MLSLADVRAEFLRLFVRHQDGGRVAFGHRVAPQQKNVHATVPESLRGISEDGLPALAYGVRFGVILCAGSARRRTYPRLDDNGGAVRHSASVLHEESRTGRLAAALGVPGVGKHLFSDTHGCSLQPFSLYLGIT